MGHDEFTVFYRRVRPELHRALVLTLADVHLAEEAGNEAMVRAAERWSTVAAMDNPEGWVYRVAVNWASSWRRKWARRPTLPIEELDGVHRDAPVVELVELLRRLPVAQRQIVVLRHLLGYSTAETAGALGIAEGTVKSGLSRARAALMDDLSDMEARDEVG